MNTSKFMEIKIISSRYTDCDARDKEAYEIKRFVELSAMEKEIGCLGIIDAVSFDYGADRMTVTKNGKTVYETELNRCAVGNEISILLLSNDVNSFADMIEAYAHSLSGETITQRTIVYEYSYRFDRYAMSLSAESIDAYNDDLDEEATRFVNSIETARFKAGYEKRLFTGFYYGEPDENFKKYHVNFCDDENEAEEEKIEGDYYVSGGERIQIPRPEDYADMIVYLDDEHNIVVDKPKDPWE